MRFDIHHHFPPEFMELLAALYAVLATRENCHMPNPNLDDVIASLAGMTTVDDGVIALLNQLHADLSAANANGDTAKVQAILDTIAAERTKIAAAILANTDAAPPPAPDAPAA